MSETDEVTCLGEDAIPTHWVNLLPDLPGRAAAAAEPADRRARRPAGPDADLPDGADHAGGLAASRRSRSRTRCATPTGCGGRRRCTARGASSRRSARPAKIFYKYEGVSPAGSHKPNTAVPQAYENAQAGHHEARRPRPAPASGARRWRSRARCSASSARSSWSARSYDQKPYRRSMMQTWGATVHRSPSELTRVRPARRPRTRRARSGSRSPRRSRSRRRTRTPTTRSAPCSTTCCCTRP